MISYKISGHIWTLIIIVMVTTFACKQKQATGLLLPDPKEMQLIPFDFPDTLERFRQLAPLDLFKFFSPAAAQGIQGSCAPFSIAYYMMSYYEKSIGNYSYFDFMNQLDAGKVLSPSFIYNNLNSASGDCRRAVSYVDTFLFIEKNGSCPWKDYPYFANRSVCSAPPNQELRNLAEKFKGYVFKKFPVSENNIKYYLLKKIPVIIGINTTVGLKGIGYSHKSSEPFIWNPSRNDIEEYHSMLIVGFDDNYFRLLNTWGSDWGSLGTCYIPKQVLLDRAGEVYMAYNNRDLANNIFSEDKPSAFLKENTENQKYKDSLIKLEYERLENQIRYDLKLLSKIENKSEEQQFLFEQLKKRPKISHGF
jgi:hypothetical protein